MGASRSLFLTKYFNSAIVARMQELTEGDLLQAVKKDPNRYFEQLLKRFENQIFVYVLRLVNYDTHAAEDICSQAWMKCYTRIHSYNSKKSFISWIYTIAHNQTIDHIRANKRHKTQSLETAPDVATYQSQHIESERNTIIHTIISHLSHSDKSLLTLHYLEEKTIQEMSHILNLLPKLVSLKLFRAKKRAQALAKTLYPSFEI
jgi:RNA polymerase sigma-70 factor, ECF subfamily